MTSTSPSVVPTASVEPSGENASAVFGGPCPDATSRATSPSGTWKRATHSGCSGAVQATPSRSTVVPGDHGCASKPEPLTIPPRTKWRIGASAGGWHALRTASAARPCSCTDGPRGGGRGYRPPFAPLRLGAEHVLLPELLDPQSGKRRADVASGKWVGRSREGRAVVVEAF